MGTFSAGVVVLVRFPFPDLSQTKLRPAVVLADVDRGDFLLCQITSNPFGDQRAVQIDRDNLTSGALRVTSYARPGKLLTANQDLIVSEVGTLKPEAFARIVDAIVLLLRPEKPRPSPPAGSAIT